MVVKGFIENGQEISFNVIRKKVRESQIRVGAYIKELDSEEIAIITGYNPADNSFEATCIRDNQVINYPADFECYVIPNEEEVTTAYYRKALRENDNPVKTLLDLEYVFINAIGAVGWVIEVANKESVLFRFLGKEGSPNSYSKETDMTGYFLATGVIDVSQENWREAREEEVALFLAKKEEAYSKAFPEK